ncbi:MAG: hypothetical protein IT364_20370 [Candidatus Hydrogenedentes bacterium]|nr:hypothetical protein [Candidatus Hydrogenedentota bacterium]
MDTGRAKQIVEGLRDHADFCRSSLSIRDKAGVTVPLELTAAQRKQQECIRRQESRGLPVRQVVLKARQVHMSVGSCAQILKRVAFLPGQQALVMADIKARTASLYNYMSQFVDSYRPYHGLRMLPVRARRDNETIEFDGGSRIDFRTAEDTDSGRSFSYRHVLLSEYAFYRNAALLMRGVSGSMPVDPLTTLIVESTANGMGGPFYDLWRQASEAGSDFGAMFFAWWELDEYIRAIEDMAAFERSLSREETALREMYGLKPEQLAWRRWKIQTDCQGSLDTFNQEFPHSPEVAFLTSGRPRFDLRSVERMPVIRDPLAGELEMARVGTRIEPQFVAREDGLGALRVWKRPGPKKRYVIGADPSKGKDVGEEMGTVDPDWSVATVHEAETGEQVAVLRARLTPYAFARYVCDLGRWYNTAFLAPEANEMGFIEGLLQQDYPATHFYTRRRDADDPRPPTAHEVGWMTTATSKTQLISALDRALREMTVIVRDAVTLQELRTFVYREDGKAMGQRGCHDDCVIALALAAVGMTQAPRVVAEGQLKPVKYDEAEVAEPRWWKQPRRDGR